MACKQLISRDIQHAYTQNFNGNATVHVTTEGGLSSSKTALVNISSEEPEAEATAPHNLYVRASSPTTAKLSWQPSDNKAVSWVVYVNDVAIARLPAEDHSINISDMEFGESVTFGVLPLDKDLRVGKMASIALEPSQHETESSPPPNSLAPKTLKSRGDTSETATPEDQNEANTDRSSSTEETKSKDQEDTSRKPSRPPLLQNFGWINYYAVWGAAIAAGVFLIGLASRYIRKQIKVHSN